MTDRKFIMSLFKPFVVAAMVTCVLGSVSCVREEAHDDMSAVLSKKEAVLSFSVSDSGIELTKSQITTPGFESNVNTVFLLVVGSDGLWKKCYSSTGNSGLTNFTVKADGSTYYDIYALVNMGNVNIGGSTAPYIPYAGSVLSPADFVYPLPSTFSSLATTGLPMSGHVRVNASSITPGAINDVSITVRRLLSKVVVTVNKSSMFSGSTDGSPLLGGTLKVAQVAKVVRPFAAESSRRAMSASEMYSSDTDWHNFTVAEGQSLVSSQITLYVPENRQGTGSGSTQAGKTPATGREGLATYLEYTAAKNGASDGVSGNMTYRAYLGENATNNFDVIGDKVYNASLNMSWDGMWEGPWRVTSSSWADTRALVISAAANSSAPMVTQNTKAGSAKVRKGIPTAFYMNFFPNGTSGSVAHSRKDQSSWPYGWVAYVDGSSVYMSGTSGTIKTLSNENLISWSYNATTDCLTMETIPGAPASAEIHTLQFKTLDGRKESNVVYFTTSIPFEFRWRDSGNPNHVAQRGILEALDADTHAVDAQGIFYLKDGYSSKVRLTDNGDGTAKVELIDGFTAIEDAIYIEDADGDRHCDVPLEARVPWFETGAISPAVNYVDAASRVRFTYYAASASGEKTTTAMKVVDNKTNLTAITAGEKLDLGLVNELIAPILGAGGSSFLGYERYIDNDGSFSIAVFINTYKDLPARIAATLSSDQHKFNVGKTSIGMKSVTGSHGQPADEQDFEAYNPWRLITGVTQGGVMNDYTLYNEPARNGMQMAVGWATNPASAPTESGSWTTDIGNVIIARDDHLSYNASFQDGAGYLGSKVCSHVGSGPSAVNHDFVPSSSTYYQLTARVTNTSDYDWETIGNYLWYDQGHYLPGSAWSDPSATPAERKAAVDDVFSGGFIYLSPWMGQANDAWNYTPLPSGVSSTTPSAVRGVLFEVRQRTETINSTWTLRYSMEGLKEADVSSHNAGKIDVVLRIINPFNPASPSLDKKVSEAYVRLHLYVWPAPYAVESVSPAWNSYTGHGWAYSVFPYCFTGGKTVYGLDGRGFFSSPILIPATETYTSTSTTFLKSSSASVGIISRNIGSGSYVGSALFQFYNNAAFSDSDSKAQLMAKLLGYMSDNQTSEPFKLRNPADQTRSEIKYSESSGSGWTPHYENITYNGLNDVLGSTTYYREDDYTLYYDPTGNTYTYTYREGSHLSTTDKLFVIHIGGNNLNLRYGHYFDPYWF